MRSTHMKKSEKNKKLEKRIDKTECCESRKEIKNRKHDEHYSNSFEKK